MRHRQERELWWRERRRHEDERRVWAAEIQALRDALLAQEALFRAERREWTQERRELLTRIQAPKEAAVMYAPSPDDVPDRLHVPLDDDEAWEKHVKEMNGSG